MSNDNQFIKTRILAASLIKDGMRIALAHSITGLSWRTLRELWEEIHGADVPPPGRMPCDTLAYIKNGQSSLSLSTVVSVYLSAEKEHRTPTDAFSQAWEIAKLFSVDGKKIDINAAWYAIRDVKAGLLSWSKCRHCKAEHIFDNGTKKPSKCPYCGTTGSKMVEVAQ